MTIHDAAEWASWGRGLPARGRARFARDASDHDRLVTLSFDGADRPEPGWPDRGTIKQRVAARELYCLVPGCQAFPVVVSNGTRHDCFRHGSSVRTDDADHAPESIDHRTAKHRLADWLQQVFPASTIFRDEHRVAAGGTHFEPDVLVELPDRRRIAVEYQYSPGDAQVVHRKLWGYHQAGIVSWWFFAPFEATARRREIDFGHGARPVVSLLPSQQELIKTSTTHSWCSGFWWFDVERGVVGTPFVRSGRRLIDVQPAELWDDRRPQLPGCTQRPWEGVTDVDIHESLLANCSVSSELRLVTPSDRWLDRQRLQQDSTIEELRVTARSRWVTAHRTQHPVGSAATDEPTPLAPPSADPSPDDVPAHPSTATPDVTVLPTVPPGPVEAEAPHHPSLTGRSQPDRSSRLGRWWRRLTGRR